jgi:Spy/CpxP family protein refolding chaperone
MKRLLVILLLLSLGLNVGLLLRVMDDRDHRPWAGDHRYDHDRGTGPGGGRGAGYRVDRDPDGGRRYEGLGLNDDQIEYLMEIRKLRFEHAVDRRREMKEMFHEMEDLLRAETFDREELAKVRRRLAFVRAEVDSMVAEHLIQELEIMTPEQRLEYLKRMPWERFGKRHKKR